MIRKVIDHVTSLCDDLVCVKTPNTSKGLSITGLAVTYSVSKGVSIIRLAVTYSVSKGVTIIGLAVTYSVPKLHL